MNQDIDINKLSKLSRLMLSASEAAKAKDRLQGLLKLMESLKALDLKDVEPMISNELSILREDVPVSGLSYEQIFLNAPIEENHHFAIPKVI